uniref:CD166 antigen-like isoform X2 n=1 Tax=Myxine glutinosa TaxID=7769 RepID=UPI00358FBF28
MLLTTATPTLFIVYFGLLPQLLSALDLIVPKTVNVKLGERFEIPCLEHLTNTEVQVEWFWENPGSRKRVLYKRGSATLVENGFTWGEKFSMVMQVARLIHNSEYTCRVKHSGGKKEQMTNLRVYVQPGIQIRKTDKPIEVDGSLAEIARCNISEAYPKPQITWYKDEVQLKPSDENVDVEDFITKDEKYSGESVLKYRVHKDDGKASYYCNVQVQRTGYGRNSSSIQVTLHYPADEVNLNVFPEYIAEGGKATITCKTNGNPPPPIVLFKDDKEFQNPLTAPYTMQPASRKDSGLYKCEIKTSKGGAITSQKTIIIHYLDPVSLKGLSQPAEKGENITLTCSGDASGSVVYHWTKDGVSMTTRGENQTITNVGYQDSGTYICYANLTRTVGDMPELHESNSGFLNIKGSPEFLEEQTMFRVMPIISSKNISCRAYAYPKPVVNWTGAIIEENNKWNGTTSIFRTEIALEKPWNFFGSSVTCDIHNEYGSVTREYNVISLFYVILLVFVLLLIVTFIIVIIYRKRKRTSKHNLLTPVQAENSEHVALNHPDRDGASNGGTSPSYPETDTKDASDSTDV